MAIQSAAAAVSAICKAAALRAIGMGMTLPGRPLDAFLEHTMLRGMLRDLEIGTVLDVGANTGQFAARLRAIGFTGRIISFEPVARNFAAMSGRMAGDPLWHGMHMALGDADGEAVINVEPAMTVMTSLLTQIEAPSGMETATVAVRRLDGVLPDLMRGRDGQRILLKMDTQGYDLKCFSGAGGCLGQVEALFSELSVKPIYQLGG